MTDSELEKVDEIWVNLNEAAEFTGYHPASLRKLAWTIAQEPEDDRPVKVRKRSNGWEMWLPDLAVYVRRERRGPPIKSKSQDE
jgi:hypothetical protein